MDFSDLTSYPMVANTEYSPTNESFSYPDTFDKAYLADAYSTQPDYSPTNESFSYPDTFDKAYLADAYSTQPDYSLDSFFDCPVASIEQSPGNFVSSPKTQTLFNTTQPTTTSYNPTSFTQLPPNNFSLFEPLTTTDPLEATSPGNSSRTPSLCGDGPQSHQAISPSLSPRSLKRESPDSPDLELVEPAQKRPQRKRGRPRLDRTSTYDSVSTTAASPNGASNLKSKQSHRLPHNQVERKYREGLNSELERLRRAVPTLPQSDDGGVMGQPKPSKAMVLAGAIDYIKRIEQERDAALEECQRLRGDNLQARNFSGWAKNNNAEFDL